MNKPLRVMWLGLRSFPNVQGGVEAHAQNLCPRLASLGCEVTVIVRAPYRNKNLPKTWNGVQFLPVWSPRSKHLEAPVHSLLGVLLAAVKRPDILHIQAIGPSLVAPIARLAGLTVVVTHHGADYDREKWGRLAKTVLKVGEYLGMHCAHSCIAISEMIREGVKRKHGVEANYIPNGVQLPRRNHGDAALARHGLTPKRYFVFVGRLVPEKRVLDLIAAFEKASLQDWKLVIVGGSDHPDQYTRSVLAAAERSMGVICPGFQTGEALAQLLANAGAFVLPSSHEGLPIAMLEAMSYGLPVIASDIRANLDVKCSEIDYFPMGDVDALAQRLWRHANAEMREDRAGRIRDFVRRKYDWTSIAEETNRVYMSTAGAAQEAVRPPPGRPATPLLLER